MRKTIPKNARKLFKIKGLSINASRIPVESPPSSDEAPLSKSSKRITPPTANLIRNFLFTYRKLTNFVAQTPDATRVESHKDQEGSNVDHVLINQVAVFPNIREVKYDQVIEHHESDTEHSRETDKNAENKRNSDESKAPFIYKVNKRENIRLQEPRKEMWERLSASDIARRTPRRVEHLRDACVEEEAAKRNSQDKEGNILWIKHRFILR